MSDFSSSVFMWHWVIVIVVVVAYCPSVCTNPISFCPFKLFHARACTRNVPHHSSLFHALTRKEKTLVHSEVKEKPFYDNGWQSDAAIFYRSLKGKSSLWLSSMFCCLFLLTFSSFSLVFLFLYPFPFCFYLYIVWSMRFSHTGLDE